MKQTRLDKMAHSMVCLANRTLKECEEWEEEYMKDMFKRDAESYLYISDLIKNGDLQTAAREMNDLDTSARDQIKAYVFDTVMNYY
jgi:hypothetical protein